MAISFDDARHYAELEWPRSGYAGFFPMMEPFEASLVGAEDATHYLVGSAKQALDPAGMPAMDVPLVLVDKASGIVTVEQFLKCCDQIRNMTPVELTEEPTTS
ncbi:hypothetical protein [Rhodococcoides fascians]|uniref:hypothetical protein n=1 Tax=Rhodococcoides fascians TaxID=1828 RepID=UPI00055A3F3C|nr:MULTISPECIES: hypothetical protein [Rhodococcus]OZE97437.1 hypothetical protein CH301_17895 [Rhodococcus sp. 15-1189-1-1a]OZF12131.1 hypothetical protein CH299_18590 [Rhodococcus sp. 14-2686-1-2]